MALPILFVAAMAVTLGRAFAGGGTAPPLPEKQPEIAQNSFSLGSWQDASDPEYRIRIEPTRLVEAFGGQVQSVVKVLGSSKGQLQVCDFGRDRVREVSRAGDGLLLREPETGQVHRLRRLRGTPPELLLTPFPIPEPRSLQQERVLTIQKELWGRLQEDQRAIGAIHIPTGSEVPSWLAPRQLPKQLIADERSLQRAEIMGNNTRYLKKLISEVGWIDVQRFGYPASNAAFLLVQHSYDLPLMIAVLPRIKADVDADRTQGEPYALLVDRLQLAFGEKQLYGSQVFVDDDGEHAILPVAEPDQLGERRAALHMPSIADYMKAWGNTEVRISTACGAR